MGQVEGIGGDNLIAGEDCVRIVYRNYRDETAERWVRPIEVWYGATEWHPEEQWLLRAWDRDRQDERNFALRDVQSWGGCEFSQPFANLASDERVPCGLYRHFKGGLYRVHGTVLHSEEVAPYVLYTKLDDGQLWVRPLEMFLESVGSGDGQARRFEHLI